MKSKTQILFAVLAVLMFALAACGAEEASLEANGIQIPQKGTMTFEIGDILEAIGGPITLKGNPDIELQPDTMYTVTEALELNAKNMKYTGGAIEKLNDEAPAGEEPAGEEPAGEADGEADGNSTGDIIITITNNVGDGTPAAGEPAAGEPAAGEPAAGEPAAGEPEGYAVSAFNASGDDWDEYRMRVDEEEMKDLGNHTSISELVEALEVQNIKRVLVLFANSRQHDDHKGEARVKVSDLQAFYDEWGNDGNGFIVVSEDGGEPNWAAGYGVPEWYPGWTAEE